MSTGVATFSQDAKDDKRLVEAADSALLSSGCSDDIPGLTNLVFNQNISLNCHRVTFLILFNRAGVPLQTLYPAGYIRNILRFYLMMKGTIIATIPVKMTASMKRLYLVL